MSHQSFQRALGVTSRTAQHREIKTEVYAIRAEKLREVVNSMGVGEPMID